MDTRTETQPVSSAKAKARRSQRSRNWLAGATGAVVLLALGWFLFSPAPIRAELTQVTQGPLQVTVNNQGQVRVHDKYIVAAPVAAELLRIELHEGDAVKRGQVVATLNPLPMDARQRQEAVARLDAAKALAREAALRTDRAYTDLQFAISERGRVENLIKNNFISPQAAEKAFTAEKTSRSEWNAAKSRQQAAQADVKVAEAALIADSSMNGGRPRQIQLDAPVDGYVLKIHEKSERTVNAGAPLVTVGDPDRYEIVVDVLSTDAVKISPGNTMLLEGWGGGKVLQAKVRLVEPVAFTKVSALGVEEQRVNVIADPVDPLGPLGDGYRIEARIVIWSENNVTKLAGSSLFRVGDAWHVFVVEGGRAREVEVKVGQRNQDEAQILSGLNPGATVVRYPSNLITEGTRIESTEKN
ncbi:MAG TPA: efflux RND transporter periplasmic adaptor subunit [Noviherbaspirillum sp.]|nr:efflux RND transporter periplasmic adaptor subunit [Noviherbaspirillum sp.]